MYVDFGNTTVQVEKAENVNNIVALRAVSPFALQTNLTAITESGRFYTFDLRYAPGCERFSFIVDKQDTKRSRWPYWREESGIPGRKHCLKRDITEAEAADQYQGRGGRHEILRDQYLCGQ